MSSRAGYPSDSLASASIQSTWQSLFGFPRKDPFIDPRDTIQKVSATLADAYAGENVYLASTIYRGAENANLWVTQVVAPLFNTQGKFQLKLTNYQFEPALLEENPPGAVPRCLTYTSDKIYAEILRRGAGIEADLEWASSEKGKMIMAEQIAQISRSITESARVDVIATLMHSDDRYNTFARRYGADLTSDLQIERIIANERTFWCFAQQQENGIERYREHVRNITSRTKGAPDLDTMIVSNRIKSFVKTVPQQSVRYDIGGPVATANLNSMAVTRSGGLIPTRYSDDSIIPAFLENEGTQVFYARPVMTLDRGPLDLLETDAQIGEYVHMRFDPADVDETYRSVDRTILFYDEDADTMVPATLGWAIKNSQMFDGEEPDSRPRTCPDNGDRYAQDVKAGNSSIEKYMIPVPWFLKTHSEAHSTWNDVLPKEKFSRERHAMARSALAGFLRSLPGADAMYVNAIAYLRELEGRPLWRGRSFEGESDTRTVLENTMLTRRPGLSAVPVTPDVADLGLAGYGAPLSATGKLAARIALVRRALSTYAMTNNNLSADNEDRNKLKAELSKIVGSALPLEKTAPARELYGILAAIMADRAIKDQDKRAIEIIDRLERDDILSDDQARSPEDETRKRMEERKQQLFELGPVGWYLLGEGVGNIRTDPTNRGPTGTSIGMSTTNVGVPSAAYGPPFMGQLDANQKVTNAYDNEVWTKIAAANSAGTGFMGGCATVDYLHWAAGNHPDVHERAAAKNLYNFLGHLRGFIKNTLHGSSIINGDFATPYLIGDAHKDRKEMQVLLESMAGGVRRVIVGVYKLPDLVGENRGDANSAVINQTAFPPTSPERAALLRTIAGRDGTLPLSERQIALANILAALKRLASPSDSSSNFISFLAEIEPAAAPLMSFIKPGEAVVAKFAAGVMRAFQARWPTTGDSMPSRAEYLQACRINLESLGRYAETRLVPGIINRTDGYDVGSDAAALYRVADRLTAVHYLPFTWPKSMELEPFSFVHTSDSRFAERTAYVFFSSEEGNPMKPVMGGNTSLTLGGRIFGGVVPAEQAQIVRSGRVTGQYNALPIASHYETSQQEIGVGYNTMQRVMPFVGDDGTGYPATRPIMSALRDGGEPGEGPDSLADFLETIVLSMPLTKGTFDAFDKADVFFPFYPYFLRSWACYRNSTIINVRAGASDVAAGLQPQIMYAYERTTATMGVDVATQQIRGTINTYGGTVIANALAVFKSHNAASHHALGGLGSDVITPADMQDMDNWNINRKSIIIAPEGPDSLHFPAKMGRFDIMGRYLNLERKGYNLRPATDRPHGFHYGTCAWVYEMYSLHNIAPPAGPTSVSAYGTTPCNTIVWQSLQVRRSKNSGKWDQVTTGVGHWGVNQGPGNKAVRDGMLKRAQYQMMGLGLEATGSLNNGA